MTKPDSIRSSQYRDRILTLIELGKLPQAIREAHRALKQNPEDAEAHRLLAWAIWERGDPKAAEGPARSALRLAPHSAEAHSTLALILANLNKHREAERLHKQAIAMAPRSAEFHVRYGHSQ